ncbi:hypothetical protein, partial [Stenotrophomonas sp. GbtcB23]|uniref:hypothetical protein n=1 Tax=Stenotrophomonas sp. GbtcB23 TaxID=2824768 RepID=UPI001C30F2D9
NQRLQVAMGVWQLVLEGEDVLHDPAPRTLITCVSRSCSRRDAMPATPSLRRARCQRQLPALDASVLPSEGSSVVAPAKVVN